MVVGGTAGGVMVIKLVLTNLLEWVLVLLGASFIQPGGTFKQQS